MILRPSILPYVSEAVETLENEGGLTAQPGALIVESPTWAKHGPALVMLFIAACSAYLNSGRGQLFFDSLQLTQDPLVANFGDAWHRFWTSGPWPGQQLSTLSFAANRAWNVGHGRQPFDVTGFVFVNVMLHALNGCLLYLLLMRLLPCGGRSRLAAFLAVLLFAVHPLQPASVVYVIQRRGLLMALFYLGAMLAFLRAFDSRSRGGRIAWFVLVVICADLCVKSKSAGLTLPLAIYLLELCRRIAAGKPLRSFAIAGLAMSVLFLIAVLIYFSREGWFNSSQGGLNNPGGHASWGIGSQFLTHSCAIVATWELILLPLPSRLSLDHPFSLVTNLFGAQAILCMVLHVAIILIAIRAARRGWIALGFGLLLFYASFVPWFFLPQTEHLVEYKSYLAVGGTAMVVAELFYRMKSRISAGLQIAVVLLPTTVLVWGMINRNALLRDPPKMWNQILSQDPNHFRARVNQGVSLAEQGRYVEALQAYAEANRLDPYNAMLHYFMGNAHRALGDLNAAVSEFSEAHRIAGGDLHITVNLGNALSAQGLLQEAIDIYRSGLAHAEASTDKSIVAQAHYNLANNLTLLQSLTEAEKEYRLAIEANPNYPKAYYGLGHVLDRLGRSQEALEMLYAALKLDPQYREAEEAAREILAKSARGG